MKNCYLKVIEKMNLRLNCIREAFKYYGDSRVARDVWKFFTMRILELILEDPRFSKVSEYYDEPDQYKEDVQKLLNIHRKTRERGYFNRQELLHFEYNTSFNLRDFFPRINNKSLYIAKRQCRYVLSRIAAMSGTLDMISDYYETVDVNLGYGSIGVEIFSILKNEFNKILWEQSILPICEGIAIAAKLELEKEQENASMVRHFQDEGEEVMFWE